MSLLMQALKKAEKSRQADTSTGPEPSAAVQAAPEISHAPTQELALNPPPPSKTVELTDFPSLALSDEPSLVIEDARPAALEFEPSAITEKIEPSLELAQLIAENTVSLDLQALELSLESPSPTPELAVADSPALAERLGISKSAPTASAQTEPELRLSLEDELGLPLKSGNKAANANASPPAPSAPVAPTAPTAPTSTVPAPDEAEPSENTPPRAKQAQTAAFTSQAAQDAKQQAAGQHKAKTVFGAKQTRLPRKNLVYLMLGLSCFSVVGAYFFYESQSSNLLVPPRAPMPPVNVINAAVPNAATPNPASPAGPATPINNASGEAAANSKLATNSADTAPAIGNQASTPNPTPLAVSNVGAVAKNLAPPTKNDAPLDTAAAPKLAAKPRQVADSNASNIKLMRSESHLQLHPSLQQAYRAYQQGDDGQAMQAYKKVLQQEPRNRDAMLGLAAVSLRQGNQQEAVSQYLQLLEADPNDPDASAALIGLQMADPTQSESRLKKILQQHPQSASLHFMLGNVYARQERWPDAQQSYFRAYTAAPNNADYMFNLAVSLDRLGQPKLALEYYQRALASGQNHSFDSVATQTRARQLQDQLGSGN